MTLCWMTLGNAVSRWREKLDAGVHRPRLGEIFFGGIFVPLWPSCHPSAPCPVRVRVGPGLSCPPPRLFLPAPACSEEGGGIQGFGAVPLVLSDFGIGILEGLHPGRSSRENKLQIPAHVGKGLCSRRQLQGPWQRLRQAWPLPLTDPTGNLPGPAGAAWPSRESSLSSCMTPLSQESFVSLGLQ